jgi:2'-5' RNA ligase
MDILYYQGRDTKNPNFSYDYVGKGFDQEGAGFYFTKTKKKAETYAGKTGIVLTCKLNYKKLLSNKQGSRCSVKQIEFMLKNSPRFEDIIYDFGETKYSALKSAINNYLEYTNSQVDCMTTIENDFYRGYAGAYLTNLVKLGFDGHFAEKTDDDFIVYNPSIIEVIKIENVNEIISEKIEKYYTNLGNFLIDTDYNLYYNNEKIGSALIYLSSENGKKIIYLSDINIDIDKRKMQYFDKFIKEVIKISETENLPIGLNISNEYGFDRELLRTIYKKYGFVDNDNSDDSMIDDMYRYPSKNKVLNEEELIDESVESQRNLEKITDNIIKELAESCFLYFKEEDPENVVFTRLIDSINTYHIDYTGVDQNFVTLFKYTNRISVYFKKDNIKVSNGNSGSFIVDKQSKIEMYYDDKLLKHLEGEFKEENSTLKTKLYRWVSFFNSKFNSVLLHELQHYYDYIVSKGNAFNRGEKVSNQVSDYVKKENNDINKEFLAELIKNYLNLPYEINARFAQAAKKTQMWTINDWETFKKEVVDFKKVFSEFKSKFHGWNVLSDEDKKRITTRLYKLWDAKYQLMEELPKEKVMNEYVENQPIPNKKVLFQAFKGGKLIQVRKKCLGKSNCNQGDINAIKLTNINEQREVSYEYSCLMLDFVIPKWETLLNIIQKEDVYDKPNFGKETDPHCTVLYGFTDETNVEDVKNLMNLVKSPINIKIKGVSLFKNKEFDVLKFDVESEVLHKLNAILKTNFPNVQTFPNYHPHITISYLKAGLGDKYVEIFNKANFNTLSLTSDKFTYSKPDKSKEVFQIDNSKDGKIKGGLADKKFIDDFGLETLLKGIAVEKEHTDEVSVATEITMDHLTEDNDYYQKLEKVEKQ